MLTPYPRRSTVAMPLQQPVPAVSLLLVTMLADILLQGLVNATLPTIALFFEVTHDFLGQAYRRLHFCRRLLLAPLAVLSQGDEAALGVSETVVF